MRAATAGFGTYGLIVATWQSVVFPNSGGPDDPFTVSAVALVFEAVRVCVLYSVLRCDSLKGAQLVRRSLASFGGALFAVAVLVAIRAGYLPDRVR